MSQCHTPTIYDYKTVSEQKAFLRKRAKDALKEYCADSSLMEQTADSVLSSVTNSLEYKEASLIVGFMPMNDEVNIIPLLERALKDGKKVAVPRMSLTGNDMEFYYIDDLASSFTCDNKYKIKEPSSDCKILKAEEIPLDALMLIPGLVFNLEGARLGRGKGYYDKYLSRLNDVEKRKLCGVCFTICVTKAVPVEENDIRVNYLLNEYGFIPLKK